MRVTNIGLVVTSTVDFVMEVDSTEVIHNAKCSERHRAENPRRDIVFLGKRIMELPLFFSKESGVKTTKAVVSRYAAITKLGA